MHPPPALQMGFCSIRQQYSPELVRERAIGSLPAFVGLVGRGAQIGWEVGRFLAALWYDEVQGAAEDTARVQYRATQLRDLLTRLGPTFIKAGQVGAGRAARRGGPPPAARARVPGAGCVPLPPPQHSHPLSTPPHNTPHHRAARRCWPTAPTLCGRIT